MKKKRKKYIYSEEQLAQKKIYHAKWRLENKEAQKIYQAKWNKKNPDYIPPCEIENPNYRKEQSKKFQEANPDYIPPCRIENPDYDKEYKRSHNLGYWVVYLIHNYNGLGDTYCGQTQNIYNRMLKHKSDGRLNSDKYELIKQCETLEDSLDFEAYMHEQGYHGRQGKTEGK